jgi:hypothetical protein
LVKLYQLRAEYQALLDETGDDGLVDDQWVAKVKAIEEAIHLKCANVAGMIKSLDREAEAIEAEVRDMQRRQKALVRRADALKTYLGDTLDEMGVSSMEAGVHRLAWRKSPQAVVVDDLKLVPADWFKPPPPPELAKSAIADYLKRDGAVIPGVHLERGRWLSLT